MPRKTPPKHPHRHSVGSSVMDGNGYPTALTPERHARLIEELRIGDFPAMAAIRAGLSPRTVERWVVEGCQPAAVEPYLSFAADFCRVEAEICANLTRVIMDKAQGIKRPRKKSDPAPDPYWAQQWLQMRFRYLFGSGPSAPQGGVSVSQLVIAELARIDEAGLERARALVKQLPPETKEAARKEGFNV